VIQLSGSKKLSVCMIVRDEKENLPGALASVSRVADEVVVVDTGSTDGTPDLAASLGARVLERPWRHDFSEARNQALEAATGEWVLCLDADEEVDPGSEAELLKALEGEADAYYLRIRSAVDSAAGRVFVNFVPRLFRRLDGVCFEGAVHEQVYPSLERIGARIETTDVTLIHSGYALEPGSLRAKSRRNADILLRMVEKNPDDGLSLFHLGEAFSMMDDHREAVEWYRKAQESGGLPEVARPALFQNLGASLIKVGRPEEALRNVRRALEIDPEHLTAHLVAASALYSMGKYGRAGQEVETYLARNAGAANRLRLKLGHEGDAPAALVLLARCRLAEGKVEPAVEDLKRAVAMDDSMTQAHVLLGRIAFENMRFGEAAARLEKACRQEPHSEQIRFELARSYLACNSVAKASGIIEEALREGVGGPDLLRCLGMLRIRQQDFEGAVEAYLEALRMDPEDGQAQRKLAGLYHKLGRVDEARRMVAVGQGSTESASP
jgi:tetratricopeptide (TPR) repeat protein